MALQAFRGYQDSQAERVQQETFSLSLLVLLAQLANLGLLGQKDLVASLETLGLQAYMADLDNQATKESQESVVTLVQQGPKVHLVLYVNCMDSQALQALQGTLDREEYQVIRQH
ncbi:unnamed protein product [Pleuronectes platessa]|uniref:Uncharacterized protein n=2 Tax=Pleuronectes platessa TaxID=8262 RepID=A0A9N7Z3S1_PLEPL|nr:unnamed protein product [Pleuronectes platessa]